MVLFFPIQQELDCINQDGDILGKIKFDGSKGEHIFYPNQASTVLSASEQSKIAEKISILDSGKHSIPMQDDD